MANGTTPKPSELIRRGARKYSGSGIIFRGIIERNKFGEKVSALGCLYAGAGYNLHAFDQYAANDALFNGYRAWVSGVGRELPIVEAIEDLMAHEKWGPEDVARYLEKNLGL